VFCNFIKVYRSLDCQIVWQFSYNLNSRIQLEKKKVLPKLFSVKKYNSKKHVIFSFNVNFFYLHVYCRFSTTISADAELNYRMNIVIETGVLILRNEFTEMKKKNI
jgi:hypothetical protein